MLQYIRKILFILSGKRWKLFILLLLFVFSSLLEALGVGLIGPFFAVVSNPSIVFENPLTSTYFRILNITSSDDVLLAFGLTLVFLFVFKSFAYLATRFYIIRYSYSQKTLLQQRLLKSYLNLPYAFHLKRNSADIMQLIVNESIKFAASCLLPFLEIFSNITVVLVLLVLLARTDLVLISLIAAIFLPTIFLAFFIGKRQKAWGETATISQKNVIQSVNHALGGIKEIKIAGREAFFEENLRQFAHRFSNARTYGSFFDVIPRSFVEALLIVGIVVYVLASYLLFGKTINDLTSIMAVFAAAAIRLLPAVSQIARGVASLQTTSYAVNLIYLDLRELEKHNQKPKRRELSRNLAGSVQPHSHSQSPSKLYQKFSESIVIEGLTYHYPGVSKPAIDDINLTIRKGESVAFIGRSGAGKTTLIDIFLGLLTPEIGEIKVDGISIYDDLRSWQNRLGYIPQSIFLLDDTIEHNIAFGLPDHLIDKDRLWEAVELAQLKEFVLSLPEGLNTRIGERGVMLSGGQRQRIGIARALYNDCDVLILDEATSALDTETENLISDAINSLSGAKTLIIIAHRYSTIKDCDVVYRLEQGKLVQFGTYSEVISSGQS